MQKLVANFVPSIYVGGTLDSQAGGANKPAESIFGQTVQYLISAAFVISGLVFLVTFIMGAFSYMTSAGDEKQLDKAKKTMTNAVMGFVLVAITFLIVNVIENIFGISLTSFTFQGL